MLAINYLNVHTYVYTYVSTVYTVNQEIFVCGNFCVEIFSWSKPTALLDSNK